MPREMTSEMTPVSSSNVRAVGHDPGTDTLMVRFNNGALYHYDGVPHELYHSMIQARSVGSFLHAHVIPRYKGEQVEDMAVSKDAVVLSNSIEDLNAMKCPHCKTALIAEGHVAGAVGARCPSCAYQVTVVAVKFAERVASLVEEVRRTTSAGPVRVMVPRGAVAQRK